MKKKYGFKHKRLPTGCLFTISQKTKLSRVKLSGWIGGSRKIYPNVIKTLIEEFDKIGIETTKEDWEGSLSGVRDKAREWYKKQ